jgi:hypothetical protein
MIAMTTSNSTNVKPFLPEQDRNIQHLVGFGKKGKLRNKEPTHEQRKLLDGALRALLELRGQATFAVHSITRPGQPMFPRAGCPGLVSNIGVLKSNYALVYGARAWFKNLHI